MSLYTRIIDLQKLQEAWKHVRKNKPAAGVDGVTFEQFGGEEKENCKQLHLELADKTYEALPVKQVVLYRGEKARTIALYAMRDKVVQQSIAVELGKIYQSRFPKNSYAYQSERSALTAIGDIEEEIRSGKYRFVLRADISKYFDRIRWENLRGILSEEIREEDVMGLIRQNACTRVLNETSGEISEKTLGIHQGSGIAPVLSNIYLLTFDQWLSSEADYYARYSDDFIVLGEEEEKLRALSGEIVTRLEMLGLELNQNKTRLASLTEGFDFLGYHFDDSGKSIPSKAEESLSERVEMMWLTTGEVGIDEKLKKAYEIIGGWEQYFRGERQPGSILEYAALVKAVGTKEECLETLIKQRYPLANIYRDVMIFLADFWKDHREEAMELLEYEQFFGIWQEDVPASRGTKELLDFYRAYVILPDRDRALELMQTYTDDKQYQKAQFWQDQAEKEEKKEAEFQGFVTEEKGESQPLTINTATASKVLRAFTGREDMYALETIDKNRRRRTEPQLQPLTEHVMSQHLLKGRTIATFVQRPNQTVRFLVFDVDISKKILLRFDHDSREFRQYLEMSWQKAAELLKMLERFGMKGYAEYSGNRGFHVWLFLTEWIPVRYANMFCEVVESKLALDAEQNITVEFFPNKTRVKEGKPGQTVKVPFGLHPNTGERSYFVDDSGQKITDINYFMDSIARFPLKAIKQVLAVNAGIQEKMEKREIVLDAELQAKASDAIAEVLNGCTLIRYLCQKSVSTGYLSHFERLTLLYVLGHLGEEGKDFLHKVMSYTLNYRYHVTQNFIDRMPEKPVSCLKLRDQYKKLTAEIGCSCSFRSAKNCYPSPVLHAITGAGDLEEGVTLPTSRTMTKEKEKKAVQQMNIHSKAQELANRILDLKKQKRVLDRSIGKIEKELGEMFDDAGIDCLEVEMGMLTRRKMEDGYEWLIEI